MDNQKQADVTFKVATKSRAVSVYGLGRRFPVTLYFEEWLRLLDAGADLRAFLGEAKARGELSLRGR